MPSPTIIRAVCEYGRLRWQTRSLPGLRAQFPTRAPLKYLPVGVAYLLADKIIADASPNFPHNPLPATALPPASSFRTADRLALRQFIFAMASGGPTGGSTGAERVEAIPDIGSRLFDIINANSKTHEGEFSREEVESWYIHRALYDGQIPGKNGVPSTELILSYLLGEFLIEETGRGGFRVANQISSIKSASKIIDKHLGAASTLREIFRIGEHAFDQIWENSTHLIFDPATGRLQLAGRTKGRPEDSPYRDWRLPQFLYQEAIRRYIEDGTIVFEVDLKAELEKLDREEPTFIDPQSISNDLQIFLHKDGNPGKIAVGVYAYADHATREACKNDPKELRRRSIRGTFSASHRIIRDVAGEGESRIRQYPHLMHKPALQPREYASHGAISEHLDTTILRMIAKKVVKLVGDRLVREVWREEREKNQRAQEAGDSKLVNASQSAPSADFNLFSYLASRTVPRNYLGYKTASWVGPSKESRPGVLASVIEELDWMKRGRRDIEEHAIKVDETIFAFDGEEVAAFASINSLPYVYETARGKAREGAIIPLVGTSVKAGHQRMGLQVFLNFRLLLKRWFRLKFSKRMFKPLKIATRTHNPVVIQAIYTHFRKVKFRDLSPEEQAARDAFAAHLRCKDRLDKVGIVRDAYDEPLPDEAIELHASKGIERRIAEATAGLGSRDARIFVFEYRLIDIVKTSLWLMYKRWRSRRKNG